MFIRRFLHSSIRYATKKAIRTPHELDIYRGNNIIWPLKSSFHLISFSFIECAFCKNKIPLGPFFSRHSKNFNRFLYDWRPLTLLEMKLNLIDCMFLSCHVHVSEWIHTLYLPEYQGTPCSKQVRNLKFKWLQLDSNPQPFSSQTNTQPFSQTGFLRSVWLNVWLFVCELISCAFECSCS